MHARIILSALALTASASAPALAQHQPFTSPPWEWMTELNATVDQPEAPLWQYTRGVIAGVSAMSTLGHGSPIICMPHATSNFDLLFALGAYLIDQDIIEEPSAILEIVAPLAIVSAFPCPQGQAL